MPYNPDRHKRRSIRLKSYDYSQTGAYFVTICAWQRECMFGQIVNDEMVFNDIGRIVESVWCRLPEHFTGIYLGAFTIMPNHFHGILHIIKTDKGVGTVVGAKQELPALPAFDVNAGHIAGTNMGEADTPCFAPTETETEAMQLLTSQHGTIPGSLCSIVQSFKSVSTRKINTIRNNKGCPVWQRNYYERVIRNENEMSRACEYIVNNPLKWALDKENPAFPQ